MIRISSFLTIALVALLCGACDNEMPVATEASAHPADSEAHSPNKPTPSDDPEAATEGAGGETDHSSAPRNPEEADFYPLSDDKTVGQKAEGSDPERESDDSESSLTGVANLNEASLEELQHLPGIGPAIASRIEEYREKRSFEKPDDIMRVRGIGDATFEKLRDHLSVEGPTTLEE